MCKWANFFFFLLINGISINASDIEVFFDLTKNQDFVEAQKIASQINDENLSESLYNLALLLSTKSSDINKIPTLREDDSDYLRFVKNLILGYKYTYGTKQNNLEAFKRFSLALKLGYEINNTVLEKAALIALLDLFRSEIFIGSKQFEPYLERFVELRSDRTDDALIVIYSLVFSSKGDDDLEGVDSQYYSQIERLDSIFKFFPKSHSLYSKYYYEKGIYYKIEKNFDKSKNFFIKSDSLASRHDWQEDFRGDIAWQLSALHMENEQLSKAKNYLKIAGQASKKLRDTFYNYRLAAAIFEKEGNYDSSYYYLRKSVDIEYELGYKNNTLESSILTVQNQTDRLKLDKLQLKSSNTRNRNWAILLGLLLVTGSVIGVLVNKNSKRKQLLAEQQKTLEEQKVSNILKEQELIAIDAMILGQEKERRRVADELHDDLGSLMAAVKLQFNSLEAKEKKGNLETFSKTEELIDEAYGKIRAIAHAKNSGLMAKQGLLQAVNQMAEKISIVKGLEISVSDHGLDTRLENSMELTLFRIIQELLTNVIKHAEATEVNIHITNHGDTLNVLVEDNGKGFKTHQITNTANGMGLKSIDKRISHLQGSLDIESELTKGTVVIIDIPI